MRTRGTSYIGSTLRRSHGRRASTPEERGTMRRTGGFIRPAPQPPLCRHGLQLLQHDERAFHAHDGTLCAAAVVPSPPRRSWPPAPQTPPPMGRVGIERESAPTPHTPATDSVVEANPAPLSAAETTPWWDEMPTPASPPPNESPVPDEITRLASLDLPPPPASSQRRRWMHRKNPDVQDDRATRRRGTTRV